MAIRKPTTENFSLRGKSYKEGMLLLIEHLTAKDWKVGSELSDNVALRKENIQAIYEDYVNHLPKDASFNESKKHFDNLLKKYNDILFQHTTLKDSFKSLLLAERCAVWQKGREYFETPVSFTSEEKENKLIQHETPSVDSELLQKEYARVNDPNDQPRWFQRLALWQQNFIKANWEDLSTKSIPSSLRCVPGVANLLRHDFSVNGEESLTYFRHATPLPIELLGQDNEEGFSLTCLNLASQIRLSLAHQVNKSNEGKTQEAVILTQSLLSPGAAATFKSRHISDASDNDTQIYEMKERAVELFQQALKDPLLHSKFLEEYGLSVQRDGSLQYKGHSFGKITLLSTNHPLNSLRRVGVYPQQTQRNEFNTALLLGAVASHLSPLSAEKNASNEQDQAVVQFDELLKKLFNYAEKGYLANHKENLKKELSATIKAFLSGDVKNTFDKNTLRLLDALQTLLSIQPGQGSFEINDERHRQSLVSTAEAVIINCMDATVWVACKSGKDRTGGASAAYDAAAAFYAIRGTYPRYDDKPVDRALYLEIYKGLFESGHHQQVASQNALGANGLVNPGSFLPGDFKLNTQAAQLETQLARLNKPKPTSNGSAEIFRDQLLEKELQEIKDKVEKKDKGNGDILGDWQRGLDSESYFILGKSIKVLRNSEKFKDEADLMNFIEAELLNKIEDKDLKKYYLALIPYAFHQGGFPHAFGKLAADITTDVFQQSGVHYGHAAKTINFSPLENGIQIEELTRCNKKYKVVSADGDLQEVPLEKGKYHYQTHSSISATLNRVKGESYKLETTLNHVAVDCDDEALKSHFFKKTGLLEGLIALFAALIAALKRYLSVLVAPQSAKGGVLDPSWLSPGRVAKNEVSSAIVPASGQILPSTKPLSFSPFPELVGLLMPIFFVERIIGLLKHILQTSQKLDLPFVGRQGFFKPAISPKAEAGDFQLQSGAIPLAPSA